MEEKQSQHIPPIDTGKISEKPDEEKSGPITRRSVLMTIGIVLNSAVAVLIATPVVRYLLAPIRRKGGYNSWISLGKIEAFPEGQTRLATFQNPYNHPWDGETANTACWVRRVQNQEFQVFAINCAHLNCPVRWFPQSQLFMCPCHGGVYYADGSRAAGPPERGLFPYKTQVQNGELMIDAGQMPTLSNSASLQKGKSPCQGTTTAV